MTSQTPIPARSRWRGPLLAFFVITLLTLVVGGIAYIHFYPALEYRSMERGIIQDGLGTGSPIPYNTLYTERQLASPASKSKLLSQGGNTDTLYTLGCLNLAKGPQELHVPDMAGRYYAVEFVDPSDGTVFATVGRRTTGTGAGQFLIVGPGWQGSVPARSRTIVSPNDNVLVIGRTLVKNQEDVPPGQRLARQIALKPFKGRR